MVFFCSFQKCVPNEEDELLGKSVNHRECSQLSQPKAHEGKTSRTTHVRVWKSDHQRLMSIKAGMGFKNVAWVVRRLLEERARNLASVDAVMNGTVPVVLTGKPLSGKTFFVKQKLLPSLKSNPVLVIDSWDEYKELRNIGYDIYGLNFKDFNEQIWFVPNTQSRVAETEVENIFAHLDMKRNACMLFEFRYVCALVLFKLYETLFSQQFLLLLTYLYQMIHNILYLPHSPSGHLREF